MEAKRCRKCGEEKPASAFTRRTTSRDGLQSYCRPCSVAAVIAFQRTSRGRKLLRRCTRQYLATPAGKAAQIRRARAYRQRHPEKARAGDMVRSAIKAGRIERKPCEVCGSRTHVDAHHDDYSKPLTVRWLCRAHHVEHHRSVA